MEAAVKAVVLPINTMVDRAMMATAEAASKTASTTGDVSKAVDAITAVVDMKAKKTRTAEDASKVEVDMGAKKTRTAEDASKVEAMEARSLMAEGARSRATVGAVARITMAETQTTTAEDDSSKAAVVVTATNQTTSVQRALTRKANNMVVVTDNLAEPHMVAAAWHRMISAVPTRRLKSMLATLETLTCSLLCLVRSLGSTSSCRMRV